MSKREPHNYKLVTLNYGVSVVTSKIVELHGRVLIFTECDTLTHSQGTQMDGHTHIHLKTDKQTQTHNELQLTQEH